MNSRPCTILGLGTTLWDVQVESEILARCFDYLWDAIGTIYRSFGSFEDSKLTRILNRVCRGHQIASGSLYECCNGAGMWKGGEVVVMELMRV